MIDPREQGGGTLARYLAENGPMPLDALLRLGRQLCRGLSHLHSRGLIHRDVSPENIWLDERFVAHLGDFDSAVTAGTDIALLPITTGSYASPEELAGHPVEARSAHLRSDPTARARSSQDYRLGVP